MTESNIQIENRSVAEPAGARPGSYIITAHTVRTMRTYAIFENEMESLALYNWVTGLFCSFGTACVAFAIGQVVDLAKQAPTTAPSPVSSGLVGVVVAICLILAAVSYIIGGIAFFKRKSQLERIKSACKTIEAPASVS